MSLRAAEDPAFGATVHPQLTWCPHEEASRPETAMDRLTCHVRERRQSDWCLRRDLPAGGPSAVQRGRDDRFHIRRVRACARREVRRRYRTAPRWRSCRGLLEVTHAATARNRSRPPHQSSPTATAGRWITDISTRPVPGDNTQRRQAPLGPARPGRPWRVRAVFGDHARDSRTVTNATEPAFDESGWRVIRARYSDTTADAGAGSTSRQPRCGAEA
jgi:hypothetical protein